ncbi:MAG: hypothetical protein ACYTG6_04165, partial [Planctomycetota bacterium]
MIWRRIGYGILVGVLFVTPYAQLPYWQFFHTTIVLLCLWGLRFRREGLPRLGLGLPLRQAGVVLLAFGGLCLVSTGLQHRIARD